MTTARCEGCGEYSFLLPLHGPKGGPLRCPLCVGKWNAEHGRKRRLGRIAIRALAAFLEAGGTKAEVRKLYSSAVGIDLEGLFGSAVDPLGYLADSANTTKGEIVELTSELLADAIKLTHPDHHPPEREELAHRTTQRLLALQPFVFPAPKPKPSLGEIFRNYGASNRTPAPRPATKGPTYPCADCKSTIPKNYCTACRSEFEKRLAEENERERAKQRKQYAARRARRWHSKACEGGCGKTFIISGGSGKHKRKDARFCSDTCRQRAHRKAVTDKTRSTAEPSKSRDNSPGEPR
jgi:hypothetical protein